MLTSINPLVERSRNSRFPVTFTAYLVGSVVGGALFGGVLGLIGAGVHALLPWSEQVTAVAVMAVCAVGLLLDAGVAGLRLPTVRRQVNEDMLAEYRGWLYGLVFGFQLGIGVVTIVTTATVYVAFVLAFLSGSPWSGLVIGAVFGIVRALPMLLVIGVREPGQLRRTVRRAQGWARPAQRVAQLSLLAAATVAAITIGT